LSLVVGNDAFKFISQLHGLSTHCSVFTCKLCMIASAGFPVSSYYYCHFTALWTLSGTTWLSWYQKTHSPTHTYLGHQSSHICIRHL